MDSPEGNQCSTPPDYANDPNWIENALAFDDLADPVSTAGTAGISPMLTGREVRPMLSLSGSGDAPSGSVIPTSGTTAPATATCDASPLCASRVVEQATPPSNAGLRHIFILCPTIESIPAGRRDAKILKCGIAGCASLAMFDRHFEMKRHMESHFRGQFPCNVPGCKRGTSDPFTRVDKLVEHMRNFHGGSQA